jgi:hypothetical protein
LIEAHRKGATYIVFRINGKKVRIPITEEIIKELVDAKILI